MRKKKDGDTLGEKIEKNLEKLKKKNASQLLGDSFYQQVFEKGIPFYLRKTNFLRDMKTFKPEGDDEEVRELKLNKTMNSIDELL